MTTTDALGNTTRTVGKMFFALMLLLIAVAVGFGGTALFVYHQFGEARHPSQPARNVVVDRRLPVQGVARRSPELRRVASLSSDQPAYTYADNNDGQPTTPGQRAHLTSTVPAPLEAAAQANDPSDAPVRLNDPESHLILDPRTGRVIGIDGSAGARREAQEENLQVPPAPSRVVAVQTPPPEVRVASPVLADGIPVYHGTAVPPTNVASSQYVPVRKALPVATDEVGTPGRVFNAGEYMLNDQDRPVLRAQAVVPAGARVVKTVRVYRLQDGSQTVAAE